MGKKIEQVSDKFWDETVNETNKYLIEEFLSQQHFSPATLKQYESALKIFAKWIYDTTYSKKDGEEKLITDLKPRDALKYQNWLISVGLSPNGVKFKRSAVSSLCGFIEVYYNDEYPNFRNIYSKAIKNVPKINKKEKLPLSMAEINKLVKELTKREDWQKIAYIWFIYITGCRREESRQVLKEIATYERMVSKEKVMYLTHFIRAKGGGREGKPRKFKFDERAMQAIKRWVEYRESQVNQTFGDTCPYLFVSKKDDDYRQLSANTFNLWCEEFSKILGGRPVHPHLFRSSRATNAKLEGNSIQAIQSLLGHNSSETTELYIVTDDEDVEDDLY